MDGLAAGQAGDFSTLQPAQPSPVMIIIMMFTKMIHDTGAIGTPYSCAHTRTHNRISCAIVFLYDSPGFFPFLGRVGPYQQLPPPVPYLSLLCSLTNQAMPPSCAEKTLQGSSSVVRENQLVDKMSTTGSGASET